MSTEKEAPLDLGAPPAALAVSWAEKIRAAKALPAAPSVAAAVVVAPAAENNDSAKDAAAAAASEFCQLPESEKGVVVLDANAFIKGFDNFLTTADVFVTTSQVIEECKDRKTRDFLDRIPVPVQILDPTPASIKRVVETAEKTGDIGVLSRTDLRLCALALDCAAQVKALGTAVDPKAIKVNDDEQSDEEDHEEEEEDQSDDDDEAKDAEKKNDNWLEMDTSDDEADSSGAAKSNNKKKGEMKNKKKNDKKKQGGEGDTVANKKPRYNESLLPGWGEFDDDWGVEARQSAKKQVAARNAASAGDASTEKEDEKEKKKKEDDVVAAPAAAAASAASAASTQQSSSSNKPCAITPSNILKPNSYSGGYACVTSDFPMQNVLLHLGVPVVSSSNAQCIRELRVWVQRCHACTCIVHDTTRQFCPDCGSGDTLRRVHYVLDDQGEKHLFINFRHRISTRGTIFNLSKPRGGRKGTNKTMVLREDQLRNAGKGSSAASRSKNDRGASSLMAALTGGAEDDDGLRGFGERDSKAGRRDGNFMMERSSYSRKNVNEQRKVRASRKK